MQTQRDRPGGISWWIKIPYTLWAAVLIPVWIRYQGPQNFLWLSDVALLGTWIGRWLENRRLISTMAVGSVLPELGWTLVFLGRLLIDAGPLERSGDMFDAQTPLFVRSLSLFHVFLPPLAIWLVCRVGYDRRGFPLQIALAVLVLVLSRVFAGPVDNVNFVYGFGEPPEPPLPHPVWLVTQFLLLAFGAYLPVHLLFKRWTVDR